jgi:hypothetical protein
MKTKHGGERQGAGRKPRPTPKSKSIWCGQITEDQRDFIIQSLTPEERFQILLMAATHNTTTGKVPPYIIK